LLLHCHHPYHYIIATFLPPFGLSKAFFCTFLRLSLRFSRNSVEKMQAKQGGFAGCDEILEGLRRWLLRNAGYER